MPPHHHGLNEIVTQINKNAWRHKLMQRCNRRTTGNKPSFVVRAGSIAE